VAAVVHESGVATGLCHVFCHHTSASLILCENADPTVRRDLEAFMARLVPDGDACSSTLTKGPTTCPRTCARSSPTQTSPAGHPRGLALGTWQGVYLWEHAVTARRGASR